MLPDALVMGLAQVGVVGLVLGWFLLSNGPRLDKIEDTIERTAREHTAALDRNTRALMIAVINDDQASPAVKREARRLYGDAGGRDIAARRSDDDNEG